MLFQRNPKNLVPTYTPWNKGKIVGQKPPLQPKHIWAIRARLEIDNRIRDLALFNLAIDSKLRGCDLVNLKISDVAPNGYTVERATIRQRKTGRPVKFEITEQTRRSVDSYLIVLQKDPQGYLFSGRQAQEDHLSTRQYARLVAQWVNEIGLAAGTFGTHSLRRTSSSTMPTSTP